MVKKLLLTFSIFFVGCANKEIIIKDKYIKRKCPAFEYNITIPESNSFTIKQKNGKIIINKKDFVDMVRSYTFMKEELKGVKQAIMKYNKQIQRINNEKH